MPPVAKRPDPRSGTGPGELLIFDENRFAWAALEQLAEADAHGPRVVFVEGPAGVGKSLLVQHFLERERRIRPQQAALCETASALAAELADASMRGAIPKFQQRRRNLDLFVLEDVTALSGRRETQQQLVAIFDDILRDDGRLVFTSRRAPGEVPDVLPRLVNRWHGGVLAGVGLPGFESRLTLLRQFARMRDVRFTPDALEELATALPVSPRELAGVVVQMQTAARARRAPLDAEFVRGQLSAEVRPRSATLSEIARAVARHFGVTLTGLRAKDRSQSIVLPRQCGMYLSRELTAEPLQSIAAFYGRHHSTVLHACRRIGEDLPDDPTLRQHLTRIRNRLGLKGVA